MKRDGLFNLVPLIPVALGLLSGGSVVGVPESKIPNTAEGSCWACLPPAPEGFHWRFLACLDGQLPNVPIGHGCLGRQLWPDNDRDELRSVRVAERK